MKRFQISVAILLAYFVGLGSALFLLPIWVRPVVTAVQDGKPADWIGFAGSIVGAIGALIAAAIAWFAIQSQIKSASDLEAKHGADAHERLRLLQEGAKQVAVTVLTQPIHAATGALLSIRHYLAEADPQLAANWERAAGSAFAQLDLVLDRFTLRENVAEMNVNDRLIYLILVSQLATIVIIHKNPVGILTKRGEFEVARNQLEGLEKYLEIFDSDLARSFRDDSKI